MPKMIKGPFPHCRLRVRHCIFAFDATLLITYHSLTGLSGAEGEVPGGSSHPLITVTINPLEQDEVLDVVVMIIEVLS